MKNAIMKLTNHFLFLFFFFLFFQNLSAQSLLEEGNQWSTGSYDFMGNLYVKTIRIEGDTMVNNILYKKMLMTNEDPISSNWNLSGLVREDATQKIWKLNNLGDEELIYNLNISVGDTLTANFDPDLQAVVTMMDSIELNDGTYRKRWALSSLECGNGSFINDYWIEGIGSENYVFDFIDVFCYFDYGNHLRCFSNNGNYLYGTPNGVNCYVPTIISTNEINQNNFKIFPNPSQDFLNLEYDDNLQVDQIEIFDAKGSLHQSMISNPKKSKIEIVDFPAGVYFIKIKVANHQLIFKKIIKL